jgi:tRNA uridine 5-carboxymethylaminomethyl modification enzyme
MNTDIIVVGAGHAGIEAAAIAAKTRLSVILITTNADLIGQMSCNPAIGGIAKGNIVREIDALGGVMGRITDMAGIQFRMLNKTKGIAVWGNRAQTDKAEYRKLCRKHLESIANLQIYQDTVVEISVSCGRIDGVITLSGEKIHAKAVVLAMGTFLNGLAHIGQNSFPCGRLGEPASMGLTESIASFGIKTGRLKTGTPARIDGKTVDFSKMTIQNGDEKPWPFSYSTPGRPQNRAVCWVVKTNTNTHRVILDNISKSALYGGKIKGIGPRYCPSIEDKLVKFGERDGHTLFLEPEGLETGEMYLNGFSTSLPIDIQIAMLQTLPGLSVARIIKPAYAIEYDYFLPVQLYPTLESRVVENLFFAGQINGTSGYEEAACQGLVAGINAAEKIRGGQPLVLGRDSSYTGVLIDDLITKGTEEPYRMFTSRAEYRLVLRQDNSDERLMPIAFSRGLISSELYNFRKGIWGQKAGIKEKLEEIKIKPDDYAIGNEDRPRQQISAIEFLKRPKIKIKDLPTYPEIDSFSEEVCVGVEADIKYGGFVRRQKEEIDRFRRMENAAIPEGINYDEVPGLLNESRAKLKKIRPLSLGQAARISGVTPADVSILITHVFK